MLELLTKEQFEKQLNTTFTIQFQPEVNMDAELVEVKGLGGDTELDRKPFSILLRTTQKGQYYTQSTYSITHPEMGALTVFLSPKGPGSGGMLYEAVFS